MYLQTENVRLKICVKICMDEKIYKNKYNIV